MWHAIIQYFKDARIELTKVVWPTRGEVVNHTLMVIAISIGVAIFLGAIDYIFNFALQFFVLS